jgi:hypothetical protein
VSRLTDYFKTNKDIDVSKIGVTRHSRWGKTALAVVWYMIRVWLLYFPAAAEAWERK